MSHTAWSERVSTSAALEREAYREWKDAEDLVLAKQRLYKDARRNTENVVILAYNAGFSLNDIGRWMNRTSTTIQSMLKKHGVIRRSRGKRVE